jgi:uncharacterized tellurite resistance protein B-like protein
MTRDRRPRGAELLDDSFLSALEDLIDTCTQAPSDAGLPEVSQRNIRLATAVLIVEITRADFEISASERQAILDAVQHSLQLTPEETAELAGAASAQAGRPPRLHEYADLVDRWCSPAHKRRIVEALWQVAFADAELLAHEEYLVRKVSELLHVSRADFIEAKIRAREAFR